MPSARFGYLTRRLAYLRQLLLPPTFSPTGDYRREDFDRARGYRLLAHAEIEAYIEDRARSVAVSALRTWLKHRRPTRVLVNLLAFHLVHQGLTKTQLKEVFTRSAPHTDDAAKAATQAFMKALSDNHGIREDNILRMLLPLGIQTPDVDPAWLSTIDSFGKSRGETAHTSMKIQAQPDPQTELQTVSEIITGLEIIDRKFSGL